MSLFVETKILNFEKYKYFNLIFELHHNKNYFIIRNFIIIRFNSFRRIQSTYNENKIITPKGTIKKSHW